MSFQDTQSVSPAISDTSSPVEKQVWTKPRLQLLGGQSTFFGVGGVSTDMFATSVATRPS